MYKKWLCIHRKCIKKSCRWCCSASREHVQINANPQAGDRCHCKLLDLYISKLPAEAKEKDIFYVRPMEKLNKNLILTYERSTWYYSIPIGTNKLSQMFRKYADWETFKDIKQITASEPQVHLWSGVIIQEQTGHECLRMYERTSEKQQAVSNILSSSYQSTYQAQLAKLNSYQRWTSPILM